MKPMNYEFVIAYNAFIAGVKEMIEADYEKNNFPVELREEIDAEIGRKYMKVIKKGPGSCYVYAFIDKVTGDIYKPASWKAPAKHARGNVFAADHGLSCAGVYTIAYMR